MKKGVSEKGAALIDKEIGSTSNERVTESQSRCQPPLHPGSISCLTLEILINQTGIWKIGQVLAEIIRTGETSTILQEVQETVDGISIPQEHGSIIYPVLDPSSQNQVTRLGMERGQTRAGCRGALPRVGGHYAH